MKWLKYLLVPVFLVVLLIPSSTAQDYSQVSEDFNRLSEEVREQMSPREVEFFLKNPDFNKGSAFYERTLVSRIREHLNFVDNFNKQQEEYTRKNKLKIQAINWVNEQNSKNNPFAQEIATHKLAPINTNYGVYHRHALAFSENIPASGGDWKIGSYNEAMFTYEGKSFSLSYEDPSSENLYYATKAVQSGLFEKVVDQLEYTFVLPEQLEIIFTTDKPGPLYYDGKIHITYEFLRHVDQVISASFDIDDNEKVELMLSIAEFVIYHEVGHAILEILEFENLKYSESVVDEFSAVLSTVIGCEETIYDAALFFEANANFNDAEENGASEFSSLHSRFEEDRMDHIICLLYGSNPNENRDLLGSYGMSDEDGEACIDNFQYVYEIWGETLDELLRE